MVTIGVLLERPTVPPMLAWYIGVGLMAVGGLPLPIGSSLAGLGEERCSISKPEVIALERHFAQLEVPAAFVAPQAVHTQL